MIKCLFFALFLVFQVKAQTSSQRINSFKIEATSFFYEDTSDNTVGLPLIADSEDSTTLTWQDIWRKRTIVNCRYSMYSNVLLAEKCESVEYHGGTGPKGNVTVTAWSSHAKQYDTKVWTFSAEGDNGSVWGQFYRITKYGCCGTEDMHTLYSLESGKPIVSYTGFEEPAQLEVPNTSIRRLFSYHAASDALALSQTSGDRVIGVLLMNSPNNLVARAYAIHSPRAIPDSPSLRLETNNNPEETVDLTLWASNKIDSPQAVTGFKVKIRFFGEREQLVIPVQSDSLVTSRATGPKSLSINAIQ